MVTYFLGPSPERLDARDELTVPVFLGDPVCCAQDHTLLSKDGTRPRVERRILAEPARLILRRKRGLIR
jgi:hypothetical protein